MNKLIKEATANYRDYVFAPNRGSDPFLNGQHDVLMLHPGAAEMNPDVKTLKQLVEGLTANCKYPIRHFVFVGHANPYGDIAIPMRDPRGKPDPNAGDITWESLKEAISEKYPLLHGADKEPTILPRPEDAKGKRIPCAIIIRGCSGGLNTNLLAKIREAFGYMIDIVVMPKHFNAAAKIGEDKTRGVFAAWVEVLHARLPCVFESEVEARRRHQGASGQEVQRLAWQCHAQYWMGGSRSQVVHGRRNGPRHQSVHDDDPGAAAEGHVQGEVRGRATVYGQRPDLTNRQARRRDDARQIVRKLEETARVPDPDWPLWKRLGFDTFDDLIALFSFEIDKGKSKPGAWNVHGVAYSYEVRTPLIDKDTLYCNYFPVGEADDRNVMTMTVDYNDTRVFGQANFIPKHFADKI